MLPVTLPPTLPVTLATALAATAVPIDVFMVAVKSPALGAFVRFVTVVIVPAVMFVGLATDVGNVTPAAAVTVCPASWSAFAVTRAVTLPTLPETLPVRLPVMLTVVAALLPAMNTPPSASRATTAPTVIRYRPSWRRCNSRTTPQMVLAANTNARKPTAAQNNRSVSHQPLIRSVATTEVAQPLIIAITQAATAVALPASRATAVRRGRGMAVVAGSFGTGTDPVGARRMMLVRGSSAPDTTGTGPVGARRMIRVESSGGGPGGCSWGGRVTGQGV